jgi:DNA polymerase elongation subunit (family B)
MELELTFMCDKNYFTIKEYKKLKIKVIKILNRSNIFIIKKIFIKILIQFEIFK